MSQLLVGADTSSLGLLGGVLTTVFLACFAVWTWWAFHPNNRERHERAARLPLDGGEP